MNKQWVFLTLIVIMAFMMRFWHVGAIPPGVNRDEAAIGYTAYSLLHTGRDEYGRWWPISLESFGDWKLPLYVYLEILPLLIFPLGEFAVRIPSVVAGTVTVVLVYLLTKELCRHLGKRQSETIALLSAFFLAISPWHIHFSRVASEANLAVFLVLFALVLFFKKSRGNSQIIASSILLGGSLFTYHGNHIFTSLLVLLLLIVLVKSQQTKRALILFCLPFGILASIIFFLTLFGADKTKISGLLPFSDQYKTYAQVVLPRLDYPDPGSIIPKLEYNKVTFLIEQIGQGYIKAFSPEFLFIKGGDNQQHNIPNFGNLYVIEGILMIIGLFALFVIPHRWRWFLLGWLLLSPIAAALTKDAPHSARMLAVLPLPHILSAIGSWYLIKRQKIIISLGLPVLFAVSFLVYCDRYFIHMPRTSEAVWGGGYPELVSAVDRLQSGYDEVVMDRPDHSPYIYFLFYQHYPPLRYQQEAVRYLVDPEGFHHVQHFDDLTFQKLDWGKDLLIPNRLLISWADNTPSVATASGLFVDRDAYTNLIKRFGTTFGLQIGDVIQNRLLQTIYLKNGQPQFYLIEVRKNP